VVSITRALVLRFAERAYIRRVRRKEVNVAAKSAQPATNERIVRLLDEVRSDLADSKRREEQIVRSLERLLKRRAT
jgi:hypothetical protein